MLRGNPLGRLGTGNTDNCIVRLILDECTIKDHSKIGVLGLRKLREIVYQWSIKQGEFVIHPLEVCQHVICRIFPKL